MRYKSALLIPHFNPLYSVICFFYIFFWAAHTLSLFPVVLGKVQNIYLFLFSSSCPRNLTVYELRPQWSLSCWDIQLQVMQIGTPSCSE